MNRKLLWIVTLMFCAMLVHGQTAVFVASNGNNSNNGSSWNAAKLTIAAGISAAGENGIVYVKAGSYSISTQLTIPAGVSVKGGYRLSLAGTDTTGRELPGTNSRWENASLCTILTGGGSNRIAVVNGLLEGCILRRGSTTGQGGGVLVDGGVVRYCVIRECDAINESDRTAEGGGAFIRNGGTLSNCVVTECRGDNGPAVSGGPGTLVNNTITRNWPTHCGKVSDYDGNVYNTVIIGQQCWTRENLRTTHYNDGTAIQKNGSSSTTVPRYYVNYNTITSANLTNYGYLYNWPAVMHGAPSSNENPSGVTGICPPGWHVPSDAEWTELTDFVNTLARFRCSGYDGQIAKALSAKSAWTSSNNACEVGNNQGGNNVTMFTAYPVGYFNGSFNAFGNNAYFWSTTNTSSVRYRRLDYNYYGVRNYGESMNLGFSVRCVKQLSNEPIVHTNPIPTESVQSTQATGGGKCYSYGDSTVTCGVCWSTSHNPTIEDPHTTDGTGEGSFTSVITGLTNGVTYYVRAYAINSVGVGYGNEVSFTTDDCGDPNNITDFDGNTYNSVRIGSQCWMKENLRTTHYADGSAIPTNSGSSSTVAYWYYPNNNASNAVTYGLLYNWSAVMHGTESSNANSSGVQGVCPTGWHVPSQSEWQQLVTFVKSKSVYWCDGNSEYIAKSLASQTGWNSNSSSCYVGNNPSQQNGTLFSAYPAGYRTSSCGGFGSQAEFFSSTADGSNAYRFVIQSRGAEIGSYSKGYAYSVRCVRNE